MSSVSSCFLFRKGNLFLWRKGNINILQSRNLNVKRLTGKERSVVVKFVKQVIKYINENDLEYLSICKIH